MAKINYTNKESTRISALPAKNQGRDVDFNEIKTSVNALYDAIELYLLLTGGTMSGDISMALGADILLSDNSLSTGFSRLMWNADHYIKYDDEGEALLEIVGNNGVIMAAGLSSCAIGGAGIFSVSSGAAAIPIIFLQSTSPFLAAITHEALTATRTYTHEDSSGIIQSNSPRAWLTLTDAASIVWNYALGYNAKVTLTANRALAAPSNMRDGDYATLQVIQGGTGSYTMSLPASFKVVNSGAGEVTLSTAVGAIDMLSIVKDGSTYLVTLGNSFT